MIGLILVVVLVFVVGVVTGSVMTYRSVGKGINDAYIDAAQAAGANPRVFARSLAADERLFAPLRQVWQQVSDG